MATRGQRCTPDGLHPPESHALRRRPRGMAQRGHHRPRGAGDFRPAPRGRTVRWAAPLCSSLLMLGLLGCAVPPPAPDDEAPAAAAVPPPAWHPRRTVTAYEVDGAKSRLVAR